MQDFRRIIAIGASAGGVGALLRIVPRLSPRIAAPILLTVHIGNHRSALPDLLNAGKTVAAEWGRSGVELRPGRLYVAPADNHMLVEGGTLRVFLGPKEHHSRPAIDPMFRSAALYGGARTVGVVLTGMLDDGTAGLRAIQACGGTTVVQDPSDAEYSSMPRSALANLSIDHVVGADAMADLLFALAEPLAEVKPVTAPDWLRIEHEISLGNAGTPEITTIGAASRFTCPDCGGALFQVEPKRPPRFLCHTGHAFSLRSLAQTQEQRAEHALWAGVRALQEKGEILRRLAAERTAQASGGDAAVTAEAERIEAYAERMRAAVLSAPAAEPGDDRDCETCEADEIAGRQRGGY